MRLSAGVGLVAAAMALGCGLGGSPEPEAGVFDEALPAPAAPAEVAPVQEAEPPAPPPEPEAEPAFRPDPVVKPAPRPVAKAPSQPAPPPPAPRSRLGHVEVHGDARSVVLLGDGVNIKYTGTSDVQPGAYKVKAWFAKDPVPQVTTSVTVAAGESIAITCSSVQKWCREGHLQIPTSDTGI